MEKLIAGGVLLLIYTVACLWAGYRYGAKVATAASDAKAIAKQAGAQVDAAAAALKNG